MIGGIKTFWLINSQAMMRNVEDLGDSMSFAGRDTERFFPGRQKSVRGLTVVFRARTAGRKRPATRTCITVRVSIRLYTIWIIT